MPTIPEMSAEKIHQAKGDLARLRAHRRALRSRAFRNLDRDAAQWVALIRMGVDEAIEAIEAHVRLLRDGGLDPRARTFPSCLEADLRRCLRVAAVLSILSQRPDIRERLAADA